MQSRWHLHSTWSIWGKNPKYFFGLVFAAFFFSIHTSYPYIILYYPPIRILLSWLLSNPEFIIITYLFLPHYYYYVWYLQFFPILFKISILPPFWLIAVCFYYFFNYYNYDKLLFTIYNFLAMKSKPYAYYNCTTIRGCYPCFV